jgi:hypothetical protein
MSRPSGLQLLRRESVQVALLVAFAVAVYFPSHRFHWLRLPGSDEQGQIHVSRQSLHEVVITYQSGQNHPLYGILAHFTMHALPVADIYAARLPALLAGLLIPVAFYYTHRRWAGRAAALLVAFVLVAADPLHYYASAARGYTLMVLCVLLANDLLLRYLRDGRQAVLAAYMVCAVAAAYSHLWAVLILPAHAVFLVVDHCWHRFGAHFLTTRFGAGFATAPKPLTVGLSNAETSGQASGSVRRPATTHVYAGAGIAAAALVVLVLYLPMLPEIRAMAGHRREAPLGLIDKVLGLARFRSWTTAVYVLLVPIALEGLARRIKQLPPFGACFPTRLPFGGRTILLHVTIILCVLAVTAASQPANFYRRFLMVTIPSAAALAAWCFAGAFPPRRARTPNSPLKEGDRHLAMKQSAEKNARCSEPVPVFQRAATLLPLPATWLAGFALGVLVSNASMSSFMSWHGAHTDATGRDQGYYYRNLPKAVESLGDRVAPHLPVAACLLLVAAVAIVWRLRRPVPQPGELQISRGAMYLCIGVLVASVVPLLFGPAFTAGRPWLFEVHTIAAATLGLLAWHAGDLSRAPRVLSYGLLLTGLVLIFWQLGVEEPRVDAGALVRIAALVPPVLVGAAMLSSGDGPVSQST